MSKTSNPSYHTARGSRSSTASQQAHHSHSSTASQQTYAYHNLHFCPRCDVCPTCGSTPPTNHANTSVPAPAAPAPANDHLPIQFVFTLFLLQAHLSGDWRHLVIPYALALLVFFPSIIGFIHPLSYKVALALKRRASLISASDLRLAKLPDVERRQTMAPQNQRVAHAAEIAKAREQLAQQAAVDAQIDVDTLGNLFTALVVTDDGPGIRGQQESPLFSSSGALQVSVPDGFQPISEADALASVQSVANAASAASIPTTPPTPIRPAIPTRKEHRRSALHDILSRIRTAHSILDDIYGAVAETTDYTATRLGLEAAAATVIAAGKLLRSLEVAKRDNELATLWDEVFAEAVTLDKLVDCVGAVVPKIDDQSNEAEREYNTAHHFENPIAGHDTIAQLVILLAIISNVVVGLAVNPVNFLVDAITLIIKMTMSLSSPPGAEHTAKQRDILSQLPTSLENALKTFKLEAKTRILATCPSCHHTHEPQVNRLTAEPTYPTHCTNFIFRGKHKDSLRVPCLTPLLEQRQAKLRPIKPFMYPEFTDHMASVLSDPEVAAMCNSACDTAWRAVSASRLADPHAPVSEAEVNNVFEAEFLRSFEGPVPEELFINRGGRMRLAYQILLDFFNPHGMRKRGNHDSVGILGVVNLNLPEDIRYKPEYMWLSIILGPNEPDHDQIPSYLCRF
ncbi:hypothetical protein B0H15DRAFT_949987 [Mycena belliarum]|uniref:Uncharacterized protein n=1 Tax=Mycena belliarum TaxID=1033014 RepID=A0AAD6U3X7_9AGAR|nr:hypothetical protein B0H15DRAFT_949987 [Mycena belliae]